jgi:hypothetical protein
LNSVYTDQIWHKSQCRKFEQDTYALFRQKGIPIRLIDAVDVNSLTDVMVTDNVINRPHVGLYPEFWGSFSYQSEYQPQHPTRLFNCFMNRTCTTRQSWFYQFVRRNLLHAGWVSFLLDYRKLPPGVVSKQDLYEYNYNQGYDIFEAEHNLMRDHVPFCNFAGDLDQVIINSCISLVIETYFDWPDTIAFSEKIFRALQLPRPVILYCMPGSVEVLRKYGFDVWDDIIDHAYDSEPNQIQRQIQILDQLCCLRDLSYTNQQLEDFEIRAQHNRDLLQKFKSQWPDKLKNTLAQLSA